MINSKYLMPAFIIIALLQLMVPAKMIWDKEKVLDTGVKYKFRTAPVDPNDPFRGKYITLNYIENTVIIPAKQKWVPGEDIFVLLKTDPEGFAEIQAVSRIRPPDNQDYVKANVNFVSGKDPVKLTINYPFNRFYMEESKAYEAERIYRESQQDFNSDAYALVFIKDGEAVLKDVLIDGTPISELVQLRLEIK